MVVSHFLHRQVQYVSMCLGGYRGRSPMHPFYFTTISLYQNHFYYSFLTLPFHRTIKPHHTAVLHDHLVGSGRGSLLVGHNNKSCHLCNRKQPPQEPSPNKRSFHPLTLPVSSSSYNFPYFIKSLNNHHLPFPLPFFHSPPSFHLPPSFLYYHSFPHHQQLNDTMISERFGRLTSAFKVTSGAIKDKVIGIIKNEPLNNRWCMRSGSGE